MRHQHSGEYDAVEYDIVLADEVYHLGIFALPILLPIGGELLGCRDIADGCVKPNVEHLTLSTLYGYRDTPIEVAAYGTRLQTEVEPTLALTIYIGLPLLVLFENPLAEFGLILVQREVPVFGLLHYGL